MIFTASPTTPAGTPKTAPLITDLPIIFGTITRVIVWFPPGVSALTHVQILWGSVHLFPSNTQGDLTGGGNLVEWPEDIDIDTQPAHLTIVTWNDDDTFPHQVNVYVVMTPAQGTINANDVATQLLAAQNGVSGGSQ